MQEQDNSLADEAPKQEKSLADEAVDELNALKSEKPKTKFNYWPEVLFVAFVLLFLIALPTFFLLKIILINICMVLLCLSIYEYWNRRETVEKVKVDKIKFLEDEIEKVKERADFLEEEIKQKVMQRLKEQEEYEKKILEIQKREAEDAEQKHVLQKKRQLWNKLAPMIIEFTEKNFELLENHECRSLLDFIEDNNLDRRLVFGDNPNMENLQAVFSPLLLRSPLEEVIKDAKECSQKINELYKIISKDNAGVDRKIIMALLEEGLKGKRYEHFKKKIYAEKPELQFTTEVHDYLMAFMQVFIGEERENIDNFVQLLQEDVNKSINKDLIVPLVEQELNRIV